MKSVWSVLKLSEICIIPLVLISERTVYFCGTTKKDVCISFNHFVILDFGSFCLVHCLIGYKEPKKCCNFFFVPQQRGSFVLFLCSYLFPYDSFPKSLFLCLAAQILFLRREDRQMPAKWHTRGTGQNQTRCSEIQDKTKTKQGDDDTSHKTWQRQWTKTREDRHKTNEINIIKRRVLLLQLYSYSYSYPNLNWFLFEFVLARVLCCIVLFCVVLFCPFLSCFVLLCPVISCLVSKTSVVLPLLPCMCVLVLVFVFLSCHL